MYYYQKIPHFRDDFWHTVMQFQNDLATVIETYVGLTNESRWTVWNKSFNIRHKTNKIELKQSDMFHTINLKWLTLCDSKDTTFKAIPVCLKYNAHKSFIFICTDIE